MYRRKLSEKMEAIVSVVYGVVIVAAVIMLSTSFISAFRSVNETAEKAEIQVVKPIEVILPVCGSGEDEEADAQVPEMVPVVVEIETEVVTEDIEPVEPSPLYPVPLDAELQSYIVQLCEAYQIEPELVLAVIEHESDYNAAASGDNGNSHGLMQIQPKWQRDRMAKLECSDLFDPRQNVTVGVDILAELLAEHETVSMALMVYNAGLTGATTYWFSNGIYSNEYSQSVLSIAEGLKGAQTID